MNNAEKNLFKQEIISRISEKLGGESKVKVRIQQVYKTNVSLDAISIIPEDATSNVTPNIYINSFYRDYDLGVSIEEIVNKILDVYEEHKVVEPFDVNSFTSWERVKHHICCKVINQKLNEELLKSVPHENILDLAVVYYVVLDVFDDGNASILIRNEHRDMWGVSDEELSTIAHRNTVDMLGISIKSMASVMGEMFKTELSREMSFDADDETIEEMLSQADDATGNMYVLTNGKKFNGAVYMTYPELLHDFAVQHNQERLIVIPSSIHEALILTLGSDETDYLRFNEMVQEVNCTQVAEDEILAEHCYLFTAADNKLSMI